MGRLDKFEAKDKEVRRLYEEYRQLRRSRRMDSVVVPVKPYRSGWTRTFVLRDDIARRKDAPRIRRALDLVNTTQVCRNKAFLVHDRKTGKLQPMEQSLRKLGKKDYDLLPADIQKYFTREMTFTHHGIHEVYALGPSWWFVFKVKPRMVTHHRIPNHEVDARLAELENYLFRDMNFNRWLKLKGKRVRDRADTKFHRDRYKHIGG